MEAPRDNLTRSVPFELERAEGVGDGFTMSGYAAVWDSPTRIDSYEGRFDEQIARGAFKRSINAKTPVLQFDHGKGFIGSLPLGTITKLREDQRGLFVEARLLDNVFVEPVRQAIEAGAIDGMSFRFQVVRDSVVQREDDVPLRTLEEVRLHELGPVVFPAYDTTSVGVRSADVAELFTLPTEDRLALARALVLGEPVEQDTSLDETPDPQPESTPVTTEDPNLRSRWLDQMIGVLS